MRPNAETITGEDGTCATSGTTGLDKPENPLGPSVLVACTSAEYATPAHTPPTSTAELDPDVLAVNGPEHPAGGGSSPTDGETSTEYELTSSDAAFGSHATSNPSPSGTTLVTNGTEGTDPAAHDTGAHQPTPADTPTNTTPNNPNRRKRSPPNI